MSCPFFKEGYVGVCIASETLYTPSIARMETYCFEEDYGLCPNIASCGSGAFTKTATQKTLFERDELDVHR